LKEFSAYYSNRLSYEEVERLIERITGVKQLSDQKIQQIVVDKALEISQQTIQHVQEVLQERSEVRPEINLQVDVYDPEVREILLLEDSIQVKGQKANRQRAGEALNTGSLNREEGPTGCVNTPVVMLEKRDGSFEYISEVIDDQGKEWIPLEEVVRSKLIEEYVEEKEPINIVAITDGAKGIRARLMAIFGVLITVILDWYHLCKKVCELMSMIARYKEEKLRHLKFILYRLWKGQVKEVLEYLSQEVVARNESKWVELVKYLEKHQDEIIDYSRRKQAGKVIGNGRMEKGCDEVIGHRQKKKGMSWSAKGSKSLGILKVAELNHQWNQLWFSKEAYYNPLIARAVRLS
jgi:hypothetical protein